MKWSTPIQIEPFSDLINHRDHLLSIGSCFAEELALFLKKRKIEILSNPSGIVYNPVSITLLLENLMDEKQPEAGDLFFRDGLYHHYQFHGRYSGTKAEDVLEKMSSSLLAAAIHLRKCRFLILTLGTSWVYREKESGQIVANCHKVPAAQFTKEWLSPSVMHQAMFEVFNRLRTMNPAIKIILTVSPVRHLRDGAVENSRSKAALLLTAAYLQNTLPDTVLYFPSYELMVDELRDYRFYAEDMVHPSPVAVEYIMRRFTETAVDEESLQLLKKTEELLRAVEHRPFNPETEEHKRFCNKQLEIIDKLAKYFPHLDFGSEKNYFGNFV